MKSLLRRTARSALGVPNRLSENEVRILRLEAARELHEIGHRLWSEGERRAAPDCLRIAARYGLPQAEADVLIWRSTGRSAIDHCRDAPSAVQGIVPPAHRGPLVRMRTAAVVLTSLAALGGFLVMRHMKLPDFARHRVPSVSSARTVSLQEARILPPMNATFTPAPQSSSPLSAVASPRPPELRVDLNAPGDNAYVVALQSATGEQFCNWQIVGTAVDRGPGAMQVGLRPGELQKQIYVPTGEWSSLSVFSDTPDSSNKCHVIGGKFISRARSARSVPANDPAASHSESPPTEATSTAAADPPSPEQPALSRPLRAPGPRPSVS